MHADDVRRRGSHCVDLETHPSAAGVVRSRVGRRAKCCRKPLLSDRDEEQRRRTQATRIELGGVTDAEIPRVNLTSQRQRERPLVDIISPSRSAYVIERPATENGAGVWKLIEVDLRTSVDRNGGLSCAGCRLEKGGGSRKAKVQRPPPPGKNWRLVTLLARLPGFTCCMEIGAKFWGSRWSILEEGAEGAKNGMHWGELALPPYRGHCPHRCESTR